MPNVGFRKTRKATYRVMKPTARSALPKGRKEGRKMKEERKEDEGRMKKEG